MIARGEGERTPPPSYGLIEPVESEHEKMARESGNWLLGSKKKKVLNQEKEIDYEQLENELMNDLEDEIEDKKDPSKDVQFFKEW